MQMQDKNNNDMTPKRILMNSLGHARNNYLLGYTASILLNSPETDEIMKGGKIRGYDAKGNFVDLVDLDRVRAMLADDKRKKDVLDIFLMIQVRMGVTEPFELINDYCKVTCTCKCICNNCKCTCKESCNMAKFKKLKFFHFGRILRNCLAHNRKLAFSNNDKREILPVSWRNKTITRDMDGKYLNSNLLNHTDVPLLFNDYLTFADKNLI